MKRVIIIGVGALGSHVALFARNWDVELSVVDMDKIEQKNVASQFHSEMGKGRNKVKALEMLMHGLFKRKVSAKPVELSAANVEELLQDADLIIDCTDNAKTRTLIREFCYFRSLAFAGPGQDVDPTKPLPVPQSSIACLHGCMSGDGTVARAVWTEYFNIDSGGEGAATCEDGQNLPFHGMAGAMIAHVAQAYLEKQEKKSWQLTSGLTIVRIA